MGRKVNPIGFRLGVIRQWDSVWFADGQDYHRNVVEDQRIRRAVRDHCGRAGISSIRIHRFPSRLQIAVRTAKPGLVIGRKGANINALKKRLEHLTGLKSSALRLDVEEISTPELDAFVVAESIAEQLERRISYRRAMRQAIQRAMRAGAQGAKMVCKGRLAGSEMGRREWLHEGRVPLHTLRADIDYSHAEALTTFGRIGVKVWIYRGEILPGSEEDRVS